MSKYYAEIILPLAVGHTFTYQIPNDLLKSIMPGIRVEVHFGKKRHFAGIVRSLHQNAKAHFHSKEIIGIIDDHPVVLPYQMDFWEWMADYYMCHLGEVMKAALPPAMKLSSETRVIASAQFSIADEAILSHEESTLRAFLEVKQEANMEEIEQLLPGVPVAKMIKELLENDYLLAFEALDPVVEEKKKELILIDETIVRDPSLQMDYFESLKRSKHQTNALMGILYLAKQHSIVFWDELRHRFEVPRSAIRALEKKNIIRLLSVGSSELWKRSGEIPKIELTSDQSAVIKDIQKHWDSHHVFLLHGVTGSGKTHVYAKLINAIIEKEEQAQILFLLPEIALTNLTLIRLQELFGDDVMVYHSRLSPKERMTCWNVVKKGQRIVIGPRSALFLPFRQLKLIIVDEEHDPSFHQSERNPHFNGRDSAIHLASRIGARVILGSATPGIDSLWKASKRKFHYLKLSKRYSGVKLPRIELVNLKEAAEKKMMQGHFSEFLLEGVANALANKEQILLFQNRRGHSPSYICSYCDWRAMCVNCDVSMTYHKYFHRMICHLCNYSYQVPEHCPSCGHDGLIKLGLGTQKIEEEMSEHFPNAQIARLDADTGSKKHAAQEILDDFQNNKTQILIGTQMIAKGMDFEHIGLVGIVQADALLYFPEYKASERAIQLMMQVAGRAGRREKQGRVIVQTYNTAHPIFHDLVAHDYIHFANRELKERKAFLYPPYIRMISLELKHKDPDLLARAAHHLVQQLKKQLGKNVIGPAQPGIARVRNLYIQQIHIKLPLKSTVITKVKDLLRLELRSLRKIKGHSQIWVNIFVDP